MQSQLVFQEEKERERLRRQNLLLSQAEKPALEHFFKGKSELSVLDIGGFPVWYSEDVHGTDTEEFWYSREHGSVGT